MGGNDIEETILNKIKKYTCKIYSEATLSTINEVQWNFVFKEQLPNTYLPAVLEDRCSEKLRKNYSFTVWVLSFFEYCRVHGGGDGSLDFFLLLFLNVYQRSS